MEYFCICAKNSIKLSEAPEEASINLIKCLQWCHSLAQLHCGYCSWQVWKRKRKNVKKKCGSFVFKWSIKSPTVFWAAFQNLVPTLPTMQFSLWHPWLQFIRLHAVSSGATKGFTLLFSHMQLSICCHKKYVINGGDSISTVEPCSPGESCLQVSYCRKPAFRYSLMSQLYSHHPQKCSERCLLRPLWADQSEQTRLFWRIAFKETGSKQSVQTENLCCKYWPENVHVWDWFQCFLLCRTSFPTLTPHILALTEKCTDGAQRILSLTCSCHHFHAKSWSLTAPSTSPSPTVHLCNTVHVQLGWKNHQVTALLLWTYSFLPRFFSFS